jgi:hypothetical protein
MQHSNCRTGQVLPLERRKPGKHSPNELGVERLVPLIVLILDRRRDRIRRRFDYFLTAKLGKSSDHEDGTLSTDGGFAN